ncbi:hypothetical protein VCHA50P415_60064 [Vibrio chagasii]|nr:hypothetical protein VCHA31O73_100062 [Vibrio chagasii]CAH6798097.1 hypothetical protein VCHA35O143_100086 [Vibrio chagasii]CAH6800520.1 hypothetical protein VCHA35O141_110086 [Vibrio chagasii]CAH6903413.1 hypothetical protein VCHA41O249_110097 [Vibrio chagasii]CAH6910879.1 hypothetical protein VCHA53O480_100062 [Vibrio chagasii]
MLVFCTQKSPQCVSMHKKLEQKLHSFETNEKQIKVMVNLNMIFNSS